MAAPMHLLALEGDELKEGAAMGQIAGDLATGSVSVHRIAP